MAENNQECKRPPCSESWISISTVNVHHFIGFFYPLVNLFLHPSVGLWTFYLFLRLGSTIAWQTYFCIPSFGVYDTMVNLFLYPSVGSYDRMMNLVLYPFLLGLWSYGDHISLPSRLMSAILWSIDFFALSSRVCYPMINLILYPFVLVYGSIHGDLIS